MSTETTQIAPGGEQEAANTEPELKTGTATQDEPAEDQSEAVDEAEKAEDPHEKTVKKLQRRIERLSGKVGGTARERDMLAQRVAELEAHLNTQTGEDSTTKPINIEDIAAQKAREIVSFEKLNERAKSVLSSGKKLDGFDEALETLREEVPFADPRTKRPTAFFEALMEADNAAQLIHYLGTNPEEAAEFDGLTPAQIGRRIGKLELKLSEGAKVKTSSAPVPLKPIRPSAALSNTPDDSDSVDDWVKKERARLAAKRQPAG